MREFIKVLRRFIPPYRKYLILTVIFNILSAILNIFSFMTIIPLLNILFQTESGMRETEWIEWGEMNLKNCTEVVSNNANCLVHRTDFLCDVEVGTLGWFLVVTDVVGKSVVKLSDSDVLVDRARLSHLGQASHRHHGNEQN